jgi:hypothetical protein
LVDVLGDDDGSLADDESLADVESDGAAYAIPGVLATANPTPRATAMLRRDRRTWSNP